jgi:hypothetical protein
LLHLIDKIFIGSEYVPQQHQKKQKEYNKRYDGPYLNVVDGLEDVFVHSLFFSVTGFQSPVTGNWKPATDD